MRGNTAQPKFIGRAVRFVVLRHETDTDIHYDWMIEDPAAPTGTGVLLTFRAGWPPAALSPRRAWTVERLPDHRRAYLDYEGPISGGRGRVRQVASGRAIAHQSSHAHLDLTLSLRNRNRRCQLARLGGTTWQLSTLDR